MLDFERSLNDLSLWQDTNRNLTKVDQMLGQYREHTNDQAEAMALVKHLFNPFPVSWNYITVHIAQMAFELHKAGVISFFILVHSPL